MALEVADIEWEAARKESKMRRVLEAAADVADEICDEVVILAKQSHYDCIQHGHM